MEGPRAFNTRDWATAGGLFAFGLVSRVPFRSQLVYHWDSAEFALAISEYNVALSQPHAPGYFLYVLLGRLVHLGVSDAHASLVWLSVVFGAGLAAVVYLLGTGMFDRRAGIAAGLFTLTSPQTWFHSCVALTYVMDAFLACFLVLWCWLTLQRGGTRRDAVVIGALLAVIGGVRQQTAPALVPLLAYVFWKLDPPRLCKLAVTGLVTLAAGLAWLVPMVKMSGGWSVYLEVVRRHTEFNAPATFAGGGLDALLWNVFFAGLYSWNGLLASAALLAGAVLYRAFRMTPERKQAWNRQHGRAVAMLALWLTPMILFATVLGFTKQPGYVLSYLPGLLLLAGVVAASIRRTAVFVGVTAAVVAVNVFAFLAWPQGWDRAFFGTARTAREIRGHDAQLQQVVRAVRSRYAPSDVVVLHAGQYLGFGIRHFQLYLPEFDQFQLALDSVMVSPPGKPMMSVRRGRLVFVDAIDLRGRRRALLVVPPDRSLRVFEPYLETSRAIEVPGAEGMLYELLLEGDRL